MIQGLFDAWATKRHLWRDPIVIPPGVYETSEPLVLDPGEATIGGNLLKVRGKGPEIIAHGVTVRLAPDFKGDCAIRMVGVHPNVYGLHFDCRQVAIPYGVVMEAKDTGRAREASGGRGMWQGLTVEGPFLYAALRLLCAEEMTFLAPNIYATGTGHAIALENDKFSQTAVAIYGGSIYSYGANAVICSGWVNDTRIQDTFIACPFAAVDASLANDGCYNNRFDGRFECGPNSQIIAGGSRKGWSRGSTTLRVSPIVSAFKPQLPVAIPTN
jgi:hypothetical protein